MDYDLIIVGGGLAGLSLAVALRRSRLKVAVVEARAPVQPTGWDARIYAISPANARFLDSIGIWQHLDVSRITPVHQMSVHGDGGGALDFSAYASGIGELAWIVEGALLHRELWETAKRQGNLDLICPATPARLDIRAHAALLELADRRSLTAKLIVAADGADSWTRTAAGIAVDFAPYDQLGVVANFTTGQPHHGTAWQWFRADGVLAWLPLPGAMMSMVWSTPTLHAQELLALDSAAFCERVAAAGNGQLGTLELVTPPAGFPLRLMRAPRTVLHRLALIGDAAHTIHPLSGHGINLGFQDARSLAKTLTDCPEHIDCGTVQWLRQHERARREEVVALQSATHGLQRLFGAQQTPMAALRNFGLNFVDRLPVIKDALVRYAMG
ncbi:MAG: UbiH/UbiF family hydroxylase [Gammaproteobacteria bacterium]|nr:UbiH/UbiF family hydroxylase [Rhodocyclaceae bacterium]MBU3909344.1 UbiH/UbiF family hydroxylase [Gammaproteobacteria bacterium]MBU3988708.1 UbiH/UbiF family hydroxylase [Gammaproteobacteria bacterium]MBU4005496.1 UbiH/UbiF family hydroxylase [Gammaproteobacteria bacterium]MBU4020951.1 UbiH/UbiF family hydroxylase [Gammaproteobacteria bacterium]